MELAQTLATALTGDERAFALASTATAREWTAQAPRLVTVFAEFLERARWPQTAPLARLGKLPAVAELVRLLLEPGSEHAALGLELAAFTGPNDELEARLRELEQTEAVTRALAVASGAGIVEDLAHWMGKPFVSDDVVEAMAAPLAALQTLAPRQLARAAPRLIDLLSNWLAVTGGDDAVAAVFRALDRAHLPTLIKTLEPLVAANRARWLERLRDLLFQWPSGARWAENALEFFEPTEADEAPEADDEPAPPVQAFRRQR